MADKVYVCRNETENTTSKYWIEKQNKKNNVFIDNMEIGNLMVNIRY